LEVLQSFSPEKKVPTRTQSLHTHIYVHVTASQNGCETSVWLVDLSQL